MDHYVYIAKIGSDVAYVGKGVGERYKHITSGASHCYLANKAHFSGVEVIVEILEIFDTHEKAIGRESELIDKLRPLWNYQHRPDWLSRRRGRGVQFMLGKWRAYVHINRKKVHIGYFDTEEEATDARERYFHASYAESLANKKALD